MIINGKAVVKPKIPVIDGYKWGYQSINGVTYWLTTGISCHNCGVFLTSGRLFLCVFVWYKSKHHPKTLQEYPTLCPSLETPQRFLKVIFLFPDRDLHHFGNLFWDYPSFGGAIWSAPPVNCPLDSPFWPRAPWLWADDGADLADFAATALDCPLVNKHDYGKPFIVRYIIFRAKTIAFSCLLKSYSVRRSYLPGAKGREWGNDP